MVKDENGTVLNVRPQDLLPGIEIYGQHEIAELARSPEKLTGLLRRFREGEEAGEARRAELRRKLESSRNRLHDIRKEINAQTRWLMSGILAIPVLLKLLDYLLGKL